MNEMMELILVLLRREDVPGEAMSGGELNVVIFWRCVYIKVGM
jgi:hypothetical protein